MLFRQFHDRHNIGTGTSGNHGWWFTVNPTTAPRPETGSGATSGDRQ